MSARGLRIRWNTPACVAALVCAAAAWEPLAAGGSELPDIASPAESDAATPMARHTIVVRVDNLAPLPEGELTSARLIATRILRSARLESIWISSGTPARRPGALQVQVVLGAADRSQRMLERLEAPADLLGMALPPSGRVYVFSERIRHFAKRKRRSFEDVLGHVLAHEIGHVVLPGEGHAATGIMQSDIGDAFATAWFTTQQARSIHARMLRTSSVPPGTH